MDQPFLGFWSVVFHGRMPLLTPTTVVSCGPSLSLKRGNLQGSRWFEIRVFLLLDRLPYRAMGHGPPLTSYPWQGPLQVLSLWAGANLRAMMAKEWLHTLQSRRSPELRPHHRMQFIVLPSTRALGVISFVKEEVIFFLLDYIDLLPYEVIRLGSPIVI